MCVISINITHACQILNLKIYFNSLLHKISRSHKALAHSFAAKQRYIASIFGIIISLAYLMGFILRFPFASYSFPFSPSLPSTRCFREMSFQNRIKIKLFYSVRSFSYHSKTETLWRINRTSKNESERKNKGIRKKKAM